jgi:stage II sporulation protein AA (anti-sigma F factor antagonist)
MAPDAADPDHQTIASTELSGEIDLSNARAIGEGLIDALSPAGELVVDVRRVSFIDSQGIAMMVRLHERAAELGGRVIWDGVQPQALRVLQITNLDARLDIRPADGGAP